MITFLITFLFFACGDGIIPLPANEESEISAVILCGEGITINWSNDQKEMRNKFNEAMAEIELCEETN